MTDKDLVSSMSRRGNWDNAEIESFHASLKTEGIPSVKFHSLGNEEVKLRIERYLNYYNKDRLQKKLDYLSPIQYGFKAA
jgi:putative transposase